MLKREALSGLKLVGFLAMVVMDYVLVQKSLTGTQEGYPQRQNFFIP